MKVEFHEIANVFPMLSDDRHKTLAESIKANGLRHPIVRYEGKILDGRNRFKACELAKVEPSYEDFEGDYHAALTLVIDENLERRDLTPEQRAMAAARLANLGHGHRPDEQDHRDPPIGGCGRSSSTPGGGAHDPVTQQVAARRMGVPVRSVQRAKVVQDKGIPELITAVDEGRIRLWAATRITELPTKRQQQQAVAEKLSPATKKKPAPTKPTLDGEAEQRKALDGATATFAGLVPVLGKIVTVHPSLEKEEVSSWIKDLSQARRGLEAVITLLRKAL